MVKSRILESMHETAKGLYDSGAMDYVTMRRIEELCLSPVEKLNATQIKRLRLDSEVSQAVFAKYLNVKPVTIKKWEMGEKCPGGPALKLLQIVKHNGLGALEF